MDIRAGQPWVLVMVCLVAACLLASHLNFVPCKIIKIAYPSGYLWILNELNSFLAYGKCSVNSVGSDFWLFKKIFFYCSRMGKYLLVTVNFLSSGLR